jgi:hypothetical protein
MSGQGPFHMQPAVLLPGFGLGERVVLRLSCGDCGFGYMIGTTTTTTTTVRWHKPGAPRGGGIK